MKKQVTCQWFIKQLRPLLSFHVVVTIKTFTLYGRPNISMIYKFEEFVQTGVQTDSF